MNNITDEIIVERGSNYPFLQKIILVLSVILAGLFVGETLFGKNSLEVYLSLEDTKKQFKQKIDKIQHENAALQKQYFELKSLLPTQEDK